MVHSELPVAFKGSAAAAAMKYASHIQKSAMKCVLLCILLILSLHLLKGFQWLMLEHPEAQKAEYREKGLCYLCDQKGHPFFKWPLFKPKEQPTAGSSSAQPVEKKGKGPVNNNIYVGEICLFIPLMIPISDRLLGGASSQWRYTAVYGACGEPGLLIPSFEIMEFPEATMKVKQNGRKYELRGKHDLPMVPLILAIQAKSLVPKKNECFCYTLMSKIKLMKQISLSWIFLCSRMTKDFLLLEACEGLPPRREVDHAIQAIPNSGLPSPAPNRVSHMESVEIWRQLEELLSMGYILGALNKYFLRYI